MEAAAELAGIGPRERLSMQGCAALSDGELVAVLLGTGTRSAPVAVLASQLLEFSGGLHGLAKLSLSELESQRGIGSTKATRLMAAVELGARIQSRPLDRRQAIASSRDVAAALTPRLREDSREHFLAIALDAKNHPVAELTVAMGGLVACSVTPADVFRPVLRAAAVSVIFVHNHPSGIPEPSEADVSVTERLCQAGALLGVNVLDHLVLGRDGYFSFLDAGLMPASSAAPG
jgi:DNA repair protein RadC